MALLAALATLFAALDLASKYFAFRVLQEKVALIPGALYLQLAENTGGPFGIGRDQTGLFILLSSLTILFVGWMYYAIGGQSRLTRVALGMVLGGAVGNLCDRARLGHVRDFLLIEVGRFRWPNFNAADVWICVGAAMLVFWLIRHPDEGGKAAPASRRRRG